MKKLLWLLAAVALLLLGLPALFGYLTEQNARARVEATNNGSFVAIQISDYGRGWFSSKVLYDVSPSDRFLRVTDQEPASQSLQLVSKIAHGPLGFHNGMFAGLMRTETVNGPNNPELNELLQETGVAHLFKATSTTAFTGETEYVVDLPPLDARPKDDTSGNTNDIRHMQFSGMNLTGSWNPNNHITLQSSPANFTFESAESEIHIAGLVLGTNSSSIAENLWVGPSVLGFESFRASTVQGDTLDRIDINNFALRLESAQDTTDNTIDLVLRYAIVDALLQGQQFSDLELTLGVNSLPVSAVEEYTKYSDQLVSLDDEQKQNKLPELAPLIHALAAGSPSLHINPIKGSTSGETIEASLNLFVDGTRLPSAASFDITDTSMWAKIVTGDAGLTISEALARAMAITNARNNMREALGDQPGIAPEQINQMAAVQAPILIETLVQRGLVIREDGKLAGSVQFNNGQLLLNDQPFPVIDLLGL